MRAAIEAPGIGWLHFMWDSTQPTTFTFDNRLGKIKGRIKLADGAALPCPIAVRARLDGSAAAPTAHSLQTLVPPHRSPRAWMARSSWTISRRAVTSSNSTSDQNPPVDGKRVDNVEVGPGSVATVEIPAKRLPTITGASSTR